MNPGTWDEPQGMPRARSHPPITIEINGRQIFSKGTNWVNPEIFPGTITADRYNELLDRALEANFNLLRTWGGAIVNKESFYELCNEKGILVWTEFPLACNNYLGTDEYLAVLRQESTSIIKRISQHPSNAFWSGGNELFNSWSRMTDQSAAIRLLNSQCFLLDPETPFISTAPLAGMGHGHYVFRDFKTHEEVYQWMPLSRFTAYSEFGMPSPSAVDILKMIIPKDELFPPKKGTSWESHHAFNAWGADTWLQLELLVDYFGELKNLEDIVANGQWLQSEGYKCIYEEARRQKPYCSMALNWCYNEPWPTAANNNLISYPNIPKPAFYAVSQSCRPVIASARIPKFRWQEGETFHADLYMLNDTYTKLQDGKMVVKIIAGNYEKIVAGWNFPEAIENENIIGPTIRFILPYMESDRFTLMLEVDGKPEWNSSYTLQYKTHTINAKIGSPVINQ
jgi:beta-mannosidase